MRRAAKIDGTHTEIVTKLRAAGCGVLSLAQLGKGVPDLYVYAPKTNRHALMEVKDGSLPPSHRKLTPAEVRWIGAWPGDVYVVSSVQQAYQALGIQMEGHDA